jgi:NitT/TauT family transport system substrate-binding protein
MREPSRLVRFGLALGACLALLAGPARAETITVTHWGGQFYGAPYAVAMAKGFFRKDGPVDVTGILTAAGGGTAVRNTQAGDVPFGEVALSAAVQAINAGQKLIIVGAGVTNVADQMWVVKKESKLTGIKDLVGQTIAYTSPASVSNMVILMALKANGITAHDVKLVPAGDLGANLSAVTSGAVAAAFSDEMTLAQNTAIVRPLFLVRDVMSPKMMQTVLVVASDYAAAHKDVVKGLIAGRRDGLVYLRAHMDEAADIVAKAYNNPNVKLFRDTLGRLQAVDYWSEGQLDYEAMNHMVEGLQITGQLKPGPIDWTRYVDTSYLPADLRAAK